MPFDGSGNFISLGLPNYPAVTGDYILASRFNANLADLFAGLSSCVTRDGQGGFAANVSFSGFKITNLGNGTAATDAVNFGQVFNGGTFNNATLTGTPVAPTAASGTNTTQIATTAFVQGAAFTAALPAQAGNAGKFVTTDGTNASWASVTVPGTGGQTTTGNLTLTSSSAAAITVTPANPGLYVTLPDATTCTKADNLFAVYNAGDYDYGVKDSTGTQLGWIRARTGAMIGLSDSSTAAGVWAYYGLEKTGITASYVNSTLAGMGSTIVRVALDANRTCFLFGGTSCYAIVYDASTQTWGAATLVRSGVATGAFNGVLSSTNQVLVCSSSASGGDFRALTLSISTNTVTVNTPVTGPVGSGTVSAIPQILPVTAQSAFVANITASNGLNIRAITVSGTVPTISAEVLGVTTTVGGACFVSGSIVRTVAASAAVLSCNPFTISGSSTPVAGTAATVTTTNANIRAFLNGNGNIVCHYISTTHCATIFKLTGTTEISSTANFGTAPASVTANADYVQVTASKTCFVYCNTSVVYANIITDTSGTIGVGTETSINLIGTSDIPCGLFASGNTARFLTGTDGTGAISSRTSLLSFDCSGSSPVLSGTDAVFNYAAGSSVSTAPFPRPSDAYGVRNVAVLVTSKSAITLGGTARPFDLEASSRLRRPIALGTYQRLPIANGQFFSGAVGGANNESIISTLFAASSTGIVIQRVEAAA